MISTNGVDGLHTVTGLVYPHVCYLVLISSHLMILDDIFGLSVLGNEISHDFLPAKRRGAQASSNWWVWTGSLAYESDLGLLGCFEKWPFVFLRHGLKCCLMKQLAVKLCTCTYRR